MVCGLIAASAPNGLSAPTGNIPGPREDLNWSASVSAFRSDAPSNSHGDKNHQLLKHVEKGNVVEVEQLLQAGADKAFSMSERGYGSQCKSVLYLTLEKAAGWCDVENYVRIANVLLDAGAPVVQKGCEPIVGSILVGSGDVKLVRRLLDGGADVNASPVFFYTQDDEHQDSEIPLLYALRNFGADEELLTLLVEHSSSEVRKKALVLAAEAAPLSVVELLLEKENFDEDTKSAALAECAQKDGRLSVVKLLLDQGAEQMDEALMSAAMFDRKEAAELLLKRGANASFVDKFERTPLIIWFRIPSNADVFRLLLNNVDDPNVVNHVMKVKKYGDELGTMTALCHACSHGDPELVKLLLERGADVHLGKWKEDGCDWTALVVAAGGTSRGNEGTLGERAQIVQMLLQQAESANVPYGEEEIDKAIRQAKRHDRYEQNPLSWALKDWKSRMQSEGLEEAAINGASVHDPAQVSAATTGGAAACAGPDVTVPEGPAVALEQRGGRGGQRNLSHSADRSGHGLGAPGSGHDHSRSQLQSSQWLQQPDGEDNGEDGEDEVGVGAPEAGERKRDQAKNRRQRGIALVVVAGIIVVALVLVCGQADSESESRALHTTADAGADMDTSDSDDHDSTDDFGARKLAAAVLERV